MSSERGYPISTIAKLLLVSEGDVAQLVKDGVIPKPSKGLYELVASVQGYIKHLRLDRSMSQTEFSNLVGVNQSTVSRLLSDGVIRSDSTGLTWIRDYIARLREQAAGRMSQDGDGLDLVQERAALAREQRISMEIKNAVARGEYAPISLLSEVLALASQAVVERFEQLPGALRKVCPDLPEAARDQVLATIADARNQWVRETISLAKQNLLPDDEAEEEFEE